MADAPDNKLSLSRRDCLSGAGAALAAAAQPALARERQTGPAGHRRLAPTFRQVSFDK
jgi:hypothetical protein